MNTRIRNLFWLLLAIFILIAIIHPVIIRTESTLDGYVAVCQKGPIADLLECDTISVKENPGTFLVSKTFFHRLQNKKVFIYGQNIESQKTKFLWTTVSAPTAEIIDIYSNVITMDFDKLIDEVNEKLAAYGIGTILKIRKPLKRVPAGIDIVNVDNIYEGIKSQSPASLNIILLDTFKDVTARARGDKLSLGFFNQDQYGIAWSGVNSDFTSDILIHELMHMKGLSHSDAIGEECNIVSNYNHACANRLFLDDALKIISGKQIYIREGNAPTIPTECNCKMNGLDTLQSSVLSQIHPEVIDLMNIPTNDLRYEIVNKIDSNFENLLKVNYEKEYDWLVNSNAAIKNKSGIFKNETTYINHKLESHKKIRQSNAKKAIILLIRIKKPNSKIDYSNQDEKFWIKLLDELESKSIKKTPDEPKEISPTKEKGDKKGVLLDTIGK